MNLQKIVNRQKVFQRTVGVEIDNPEKMNELSEVFLFKAIEEIIELRKEFPSGLNKHSKTMKEPDERRLYEELSDVILFLMNFMAVRNMSLEKLHDTLEEVQINNFKHAGTSDISEDTK